ncbi:DUF4236 domain-containing protein [Chitinophaga agri]|uniref:DUF4236 domain-containing protein n=1 Tax=Chitinophaga agri TaxID=2703787 RepID=A0A6B9ZNC2_9BACT|nr:DUF4236 domain-containing protein [Chitinophaga agri]QHS62894.1 DUF4236 domain-containing protein [Chitinophaga agri]
MAWSYRKRIKIIPGVHLNISRKGISTTIGVKGASLNIGPGGTYLNTSIPALGIRNRQRLSPAGAAPPVYDTPEVTTLEPERRGNIFSVAPNEVTSNDMKGVKETIIAAHRQKKELMADLEKVKSSLGLSRIKLVFSYVFLIGLVAKSVRQKIRETITAQQEAVEQINEQIDNSCMRMDVEFDADIKAKFDSLSEAFKLLSQSKKVWDVTAATSQNRVAARSAASTLVMKTEVAIAIKDIPDIKSDVNPLWLKNANGADLYFYPGFIVMYDSHDQFGIIGLDELQFDFGAVRFIEDGVVPADSKVIDRTWAKVNKNGTPDKRFKGNYQIPVVRYGRISLKTKQGMHEEYEFSNYEATESFGHALSNYIRSVS